MSVEIGENQPEIDIREGQTCQRLVDTPKAIIMLRLEDLSARMSIKIGDISPRMISRRLNLVDARNSRPSAGKFVR